MFLRLLPPAVGVAARRFFLLRRFGSSQHGAATAAGSRELQGSNVGRSKPYAMAAAAAALSAVGGGAWYTSNKLREEDDGLSRMGRRLADWIRGENVDPAGQRRATCDSRCDDRYRGFMASMDDAIRRRRDGGAAQQQSLRSPWAEEAETGAAGGGGGVASPPASATEQIGGPPPEVDWVKAGVVSRDVRRQNGCGSCWAMAVAGSLEAAHYLKTKQRVVLSVQELIDCDLNNNGCGGGETYNAFEYVRHNGLSAESSYPYIARPTRRGCNYDKTRAVRMSAIGMVEPLTEAALEEAVAEQPVVVSLLVPGDIDSYAGGIMDYEARPDDALLGGRSGMHAVLMVGYGTDAAGVKYWRFKNSWGKEWGEKGFGRIRRRVADERGDADLLMQTAFYPVLHEASQCLR